MKRITSILIALFTFLSVTNSFSQTGCCDYTDTGLYPGEASETFGVALGDVDGDGDNDAVVVDAYDDMEVYLNDGTGTFTYNQTYGSGQSWFGVYLVDVDDDSDLDIIVSGFYSGEGCEIWKNDGTGNFTLWQGNIATSISMRNLAIGDLDGDGSLDIFAPAYSSGDTEVWFNDGDGTFENSDQELTGSNCTGAALADFDGDGDLDAYISRTNNSPNTVWLNDGLGNFTDSGQSLGVAFSSGVDAADFDGDGDVDVVVANWQVPSQVWLNDGDANFTAGFQIQNDSYAKAVVVSDIDFDCDADVIIGSYGSAGAQVWLADGLGEFELCFDNSSSVYAHDIAVADLNDDMMPDIWAGNFSSDNGDYIFLNATPEFVYDTLSVCSGDSAFVACEWHGPGDYLEYVSCDTMVWHNVWEIVINTTITQSNDTLFAIEGYSAYQWFDCETMENIDGAILYYFTSGESGSFAVEISDQGCVDSSFCYWIQNPVANFEGTPTEGDAPLLVDFTDQSTGTINTWDWDFGDGNTSGEQNPSNEYLNSGLYTVNLTVTGPGGSNNFERYQYINVAYPIPTADFIGTPTEGAAPLEVEFTDLSVDSVNTWTWDFGDGGSSSEENPVYTYQTEGLYTVSLTVEGPGGSDAETKIDYILVSLAAPEADFSATPTTGEAPLMVVFSDLSTGEIDTWEWSFGDGNTSLLQNPSNEYLEPGNYTVSLTVTGAGGSDTETKVDYILIPVGIGDNVAEAIVAYPNPVTDELNIVFPDNGNRTIKLLNTEGRVMLVKVSKGKKEILDLQQFANGVYALVIETDGKATAVVKVVKK